MGVMGIRHGWPWSWIVNVWDIKGVGVFKMNYEHYPRIISPKA